MQLSDEMIEKCNKSPNVKGFTILDDNYIIIRDNVEEYVEKCKRLQEKGVNYCGPVAYKKVDGVPYALELRAKGYEMSHYYKFCDKLANSSKDYSDTFFYYIEILQMLSHAPIEQYLKFFDDIERLKEEGLRPDYCHYGNLFYDKNVGFSFIDVYPIRDIEHARLPVQQIFNIIVNPRFHMKTKSGSLSILPQEQKSSYNMYMSDICKKIIMGLQQYGYPPEEIRKFIDSKCYSFDENSCLNQADLQQKIEEMNNVKDFSSWVLEL